MKDFSNWGIRIREDLKKNYYSVWRNLETTRIDLGDTIELDPGESEFYDVSITTRCGLGCPFCYVEAGIGGHDAEDICGGWEKFISRFPEDTEANDPILKQLLGKSEPGEDLEMKIFRATLKMDLLGGKKIIKTHKPFQIAIGSTGEPTMHKDFPKFLEVVYKSGVVPNYTTNGVILSNLDTPEAQSIMEATRKYVGGVAVSWGNPDNRENARKAIKNLLKYGDCKVMIHHLISDKDSVDEFLRVADEFPEIYYHVLLPLMIHGRSKKGLEDGVFEYLGKVTKIKNIAFGANFAAELERHPGLFDLWEYPAEVYSKNLIIGDNGKITITPSSYNLNPILEI